HVIASIERPTARSLGQTVELVFTPEWIVKRSGATINAGIYQDACRIDGVERYARIPQRVNAILDRIVDTLRRIDGYAGKVECRKSAPDPDHVLMAWVPDGCFGHAPESEKRGSITLSNP